MAVIRAAMLLLLLAACGVEGPPQPPEPTAGQTGVGISGSAEMGVSGSF